MVIQSHVGSSWGINTGSQLGDGTTAPTRWQPADIRAGNDVMQVAGGVTHALAVLSGGTVQAWGFNGKGELGDGSTTRRGTPVQVAGLTGITQVAAGPEFSLALRSDGTVWAWGRNSHGQLGRKTVTDHEITPGPVAVLNNVTAISAGNDFALALRADGIVFAWGRGDHGQLGNGTTAGHATPGRVAGLPVFIAGISVGGAFAAVLGTDGSVWDFGLNTYGELGVAPESSTVTRPVNAITAGSGITQLGRTITSLTGGPAMVAGLANATQVSAGWQSSYAVHTVPFLVGP